ncbi:alpha/beta hydrolase [Sulfuritalea hydrogenivorans]|jgi:alpha-beta hydrolase superfamily lysophospholipase|uniref:Hydrolase, alpha/beta fold family protein n=1 Tax=Sulfuritalea hydrogenivorans sk43H TaxID=1223802 RepID=W0SDB3_9PROT|nr:alpha/beta hydrolase [Sulfuritalea hydrogenivorans]BAO29214.1 hydrolase, alpha/beta fold family protein [Sulfuritalea hydrogenivorans sk43H]
MAPQSTLFELYAADGVKLSGQAWLPPAPRAVVAVVHGIAEHAGRYAFLADRANQCGLGVVSADLRGHGRSPGERSYVERFDDYLLDVDALMAKARELAAGRPLFLMGHSMGGAIALRWLAQRKQPVAGLILSSAALKIGGDVPRLLVALAPLLSRWLPHLRGTRLDPATISRDPAAVAAYVNDPLVSLLAPPARTGAELLQAMEANRAAAAGLALPVYLFHGDADRLTDPDGSRDIHERWGGSDKTLRLWPGSRHETFNDLDREGVVAELLGWILARCA